MIGDDDVDPRLAASAIGASALVPQSQVTTTVAPAAMRGAHAGDREIVAVLDAARDERNGVAAERADACAHDRRGAHAVDVVVAVDEIVSLLAKRAHEPLDRAIVHASMIAGSCS